MSFPPASSAENNNQELKSGSSRTGRGSIAKANLALTAGYAMWKIAQKAQPKMALAGEFNDASQADKTDFPENFGNEGLGGSRMAEKKGGLDLFRELVHFVAPALNHVSPQAKATSLGQAEVFASDILPQALAEEKTSGDFPVLPFPLPSMSSNPPPEKPVADIPPFELDESDFIEIDDFLAQPVSGGTTVTASAVRAPSESNEVMSELDWDSILLPEKASSPPSEVKSGQAASLAASDFILENPSATLASYFESEDPLEEDEDDFIMFAQAPQPADPAKAKAFASHEPEILAETPKAEASPTPQPSKPKAVEVPAARSFNLKSILSPLSTEEAAESQNALGWAPIPIEDLRDPIVADVSRNKTGSSSPENAPLEAFVPDAGADAEAGAKDGDAPGMDLLEDLWPMDEPADFSLLETPVAAVPAGESLPQAAKSTDKPDVEKEEESQKNSGDILRSLRGNAIPLPAPDLGEAPSATDKPADQTDEPKLGASSPFTPAIPQPGRQTSRVELPRFADISNDLVTVAPTVEKSNAELPPLPAPVAAEKETVVSTPEPEKKIESKPDVGLTAATSESGPPLVYGSVPDTLPTIARPKQETEEQLAAATERKAEDSRTWHLWLAIGLLLALTAIWLMWQGVLPGRKALEKIFGGAKPAQVNFHTPSTPAPGGKITYGLPEESQLPVAAKLASPPVRESTPPPLPVPVKVAEPVIPVTVGEVVLPVEAATPEATAGPTPKNLAAMSAHDVLKEFLAAPTLEERLRFVLSPEKNRAAMEAYYQRAKGKGILETIREEIPGLNASAKEDSLFLITSQDQPRGYAAMMVRTPEGYRLHWESYVQSRDGLMKEFFSREKESSGAFYVWGKRTRRSDTDPNFEDKMNCYEILDPTGYYLKDQPVKAYVNKDAVFAESLRLFLDWGEAPKAVQMQFRWQQDLNGKPYVAIEQVLKNSWD